jgi:hypothetical protein
MRKIASREKIECDAVPNSDGGSAPSASSFGGVLNLSGDLGAVRQILKATRGVSLGMLLDAGVLPPGRTMHAVIRLLMEGDLELRVPKRRHFICAPTAPARNQSLRTSKSFRQTGELTESLSADAGAFCRLPKPR